MNETLVNLVFPVLMVIVTSLVGLVLYHSRQFLLAKLTGERYNQLIDFAGKMIRAAEQVYGVGAGIEKKLQVARLVTEYMNKLGLKLTADQVSALIEGILFEAQEFSWTEKSAWKETLNNPV